MSTIYIDLEATCGADPGSYLFHSLDISLVDDIGFPFPRCCLRRLCLGTFRSCSLVDSFTGNFDTGPIRYPSNHSRREEECESCCFLARGLLCLG
jgi:hypothetical protein